jgi:hypothetical protein
MSRLPNNNDVNERVFVTRNPLLADDAPEKVPDEQVSGDYMYPAKWYQWEDNYLYGAGTSAYKFSVVVLAWGRKYVPFAWDEPTARWIAVGEKMSLEEAQAVGLMRYAMRNVTSLVDQLQEQDE